MLFESIEYFEGIHQKYETSWSLSANFLLKILHRYLLTYENIYLVLDALDESADQSTVSGFALDLCAQSPGRIKILVTSRMERDIQQILEPAASEIMAITPEVLEHDIRLHIQKLLSHDRRLRKWPETLRREIEMSLIQGGFGM